MTGKTILVLGGGVGGMVAANALRQQLDAEHRVVVVDKKAQHEFAPSFLWVMVGARRPNNVTVDLRRLLASGVEFIQKEVSQIDLAAQTVRAGERAIAFDYLIIALGANLAPNAVPGLADIAHTPYTLEGAAKLWDAAQRFAGGRVAIVISKLPFKCPAAPYETALLLQSAFRGRGVNIQMDVFTPEPLPMPVAGPQVGGELKGLLESARIGFHPTMKLSAVDVDKKELGFDNAPAAPFDLLVAVPPHTSPAVVREAGLTNEAGWIPVDAKSLKTKFDNVFALGDVTALPLPGRWKSDVPLLLPKAGIFADLQAQVVAHNLAAQVKGHSADAAFDGHGY